MNGQSEIQERVPKRMTWRYRCFGVPATRVRKMEPKEVKLAWLRTAFHLSLVLFIGGIAKFLASVIGQQPLALAGLIFLVLLPFFVANLYALWAYFRCALVRRVITFSVCAEDLVNVEHRNLILKRLLYEAGLPAEFNVWMPSKVAHIQSKNQDIQLSSWAMPVPVKVERFAATNPCFVAEGKLPDCDRTELAIKFIALAFFQVVHILTFLLFASFIVRYSDAHAVYAPSLWRFAAKVVICFGVLYALKTVYRIILLGLDVLIGRVESNPGTSSYWLPYSKIPWYEHGMPAAWRIEEYPHNWPEAMPRDVTRRIPV